jgi:hexosaminidase
MQGDRIVEPFVYETLTLKTAYAFNPQPTGIDPSLIKGAQGNLWTEQIYNTRHMQYMLWPRGMALAEAMWTPADQKDWGDFLLRTERHFERMDIRGVKYAKSIFDPIFKVSLDNHDSILIDLSTEAQGLSIHYSFDNSHPDEFYPLYTSSLSIPKEAVMLKVVTSRNGKLIGRQIDMPVYELRNRAGPKGKPSEGSNAERRRLKIIILVQAAAIAVLLLIIYRKVRKKANEAKG